MTDEKNENALKLLSLVDDESRCKVCGRQIWWVKMEGGELNPVTDEFVSHFSGCPFSDKFRKRGDTCAE